MMGLTAWMLRRVNRPASRAVLVLVVLAAMGAVSIAAVSALPARESAGSWDGRVVEATGEVTSSASVGRDGRLWMEVQLTGIGSPGRIEGVSAPVRIGIDPADGFDLGATVRVKGEAVSTDAGERSALVVFASTAAVEVPASGVFAVAAEVRSAFIERSLRMPEPGAGLLPGLAVGDTRAVSTDLNDDMRTSGLSHLTAVSGDTVRLRDGFGVIARTITSIAMATVDEPGNPQHGLGSGRGYTCRTSSCPDSA
ncbi:hypothetical protein [Microbacterium foliorum]|uniref:hypothetical protein n=1 Tax=Microbacterium foliorum TaxID=104336 RepID=UPI0020A200E4|nr:hypothetical protein [Microbacterium foliorum]